MILPIKARVPELRRSKYRYQILVDDMHKNYSYLSSQSSEVDVGNKERQNLKKMSKCYITVWVKWRLQCVLMSKYYLCGSSI
jgi:hypothetical protein